MIKIKIHWSIRCVLTLAYAYLIYTASSKDTSSLTMPPYFDKFIHFGVFGLLCLMICWSLSPVQIGTNKIYKIILAVGITSLYGISDEFHQYFTPHRSVEFFDWLADTLGAVAASFLWQILVFKRPMKEKSHTVTKNSHQDTN